MFKIFKGYFAAGFGVIVGLFAGSVFTGYLSGVMKAKQAEEEPDPDIETEE